jgi:hypothetical protein
MGGWGGWGGGVDTRSWLDNEHRLLKIFRINRKLIHLYTLAAVEPLNKTYTVE